MGRDRHGGRLRGSRVTLSANPVKVLTAARGMSSLDPDQPMVVVGFGETFADAEFVAFTFAEAERLRELLAIAMAGECSGMSA